MPKLHPAVEIRPRGILEAEVRDHRTGLHFVASFDTEATLAGIRDHNPLFAEIGFYEEASSRELLDRQWPTWRGLQQATRDRALEEMVEYGTASIPYYRNMFARIAPPSAVGDLASVPVMTKDALRQNFNGLVPDNTDILEGLQQRSLTAARTSGTTGERMQVLVDMRLDRVPPEYERVWGVRFQTDAPRTAILAPPNCVNVECRLGSASMDDRMAFQGTLVCNATGDVFRATDDLIDNIVSELWAFRPDILLVNPIYAHWIGRRARARQLDFPPVTLVLSSYQYMSRCQRRGLGSLFGAPVYNTYTTTELAGCQLGVECQHGNWHVREDHSIVEVVDDVGQPVPLGEIGSIAATTWAARISPLLLFVPGDLARLVDKPCACPLCGWQCFEMHGRSSEVIWHHGQRLTTRQIDELVSPHDGIDFYQCRNGPNGLDIDVIPSSGGYFDPYGLEQALCCDVRVVDRLVALPSMKVPLVYA